MFRLPMVLLMVVAGAATFTLAAQNAPQEATLLGQWSRTDLVGSSAYSNVYNEVWGLAINGREYGVIGSTLGTHFIDVTDPQQPVEVVVVPGSAQGGSIIHRDYHNYGCYLYAVCDEGPSSLQIMDLSYLPDSVPVRYDRSDQIRRAHNIFIDTAQAMLYAFAVSGGPQGFSAMRVYDLADPLQPFFRGAYNQFGEVQAGHVHDGYVHDGMAFLNCGNDGLAVVDFSDPGQPQTLGTLTQYNFAGYNHSGWANADLSYYYFADENHGRPIKALDLSDLENLSVTSTFYSGEDAQLGIPHNQIVACNYLYVSYYYDGLRVYDLTNPAQPTLAWYYDTSTWPYDQNYRGAWGVYPYLPSGNVLVSDMQNGLFVLTGPGDVCDAREISRVMCTPLTTAVSEAPRVPLHGLEVYPQPAADGFTLVFDLIGLETSLQAELLDFTGRGCWRQHFTNLAPGTQRWDIPASDLPAGMYLLRLSGQGWQHTVKVAIE